MPSPKVHTVAIIGSFRRHYQDVCSALATFRDRGIEVLSPAGNSIIEPGIEFVRFTSDSSMDDDATIQSKALVRIISASATYVVAPEGYVGRTTCYEIGRLVQARRPLYFSAQPADLPFHVPATRVVQPGELADLVLRGVLETIHENADHPSVELEQDLF